MKFSIKGKKFIYTLCIIASGLFTSCSSDTPETDYKDPETDNPSTGNPGDDNDNNPDAEPYRMTFNASEASNTRASVDEDSMNGGNGSTNSFRWDAGDEIMIWTGDASNLTSCLFTTVEGGLNSALFEYVGDKVESKRYFGFYPYAEELNYENVAISVPTGGEITQTEKGISKHLGKYRPMYSNAVNREESSETLTGLTFKHITSLLYFRLRNLSGGEANLESITMRASSNVFSSEASLVFNAEGEASVQMPDDSKTDYVTLSFGEEGSGITWNDQEITTGYLPVLPVYDLSGVVLTLIIKADGREYTTLKISNAESFLPAHYYQIGLTLKENSITIDSFIPDWEQGEETIIPVE